MSLQSFQCIYCRASGPSIRFTREHVLQQGFGQFHNAPVLHNGVCDDCNQWFSGTLDLALTRESIEGLERYQWGVKKAKDIEKFRFKSIELRAQDFGELSGARMEFFAHEDAVRARPAAGGAVRNADGDDFTHFSVTDILSGSWAHSPVDWRRGIKLFGDDETTARMRRALEDQGVTLQSWRPLSIPASVESVEVGQVFSVTPLMKRSIAKIGFNYLAFRRGAEFTLLSAFDPIRRFIREGIEPQLTPIESTFELPFQTNHPDGLRPVLHWIELSTHENHRNLLGTVMLFGLMEHTIILAEDFKGPWFGMPLAHMYNLKDKTAREVEPQKPRWRHADS